MAQINFTLDSDKVIELDTEKIDWTEPAEAPDGHSYTRLSYTDYSVNNETKFYAIKDCRPMKKLCQQLSR